MSLLNYPDMRLGDNVNLDKSEVQLLNCVNSVSGNSSICFLLIKRGKFALTFNKSKIVLVNKDLVEQVKNSDITAFNALFKMHYVSLYVFCRKYVVEPEQAKDMLQNVFMRFWEKRSEINIDTSVQSYLFVMVRNECLNYIRKNKSEGVHITLTKHELVLDNYLPDIITQKNEIEELTNRTIEKLPEQCRKIFIMSRVDGYQNMEIAKMLDISVRTVESQIYKALKVLKIKLKDYYWH